MARASRDFETFNMQGDAGGGYARGVSAEGQDLRAVAQVFQGFGARLGQMADKAARVAGAQAGAAAADAALALPEVTFKLKPGQTDENGTGRREPASPPAGGGDYFARLAQIESGGNPKARNKDSGASGLYQFMPGTARQYGLDDPFDPVKARAAVERLTADNRAALRKGLGREPSAGELYLAHQQGAGGALKLLRNPNARAADVVGGKAVTLNGGTADMTAGQFANLWVGKFEGGGGGGGALPAFTPGPREYQMQVSVAPPAPLALRRDGTIAGDAYDRALAETAGWKMQAGLDAELAQAFDTHKDDPQAYAAAVKEVADRYVKEAQAIGPEISAAITERASGQLLGYARDVQARSERRADEERRTTALAAVTEAASGIERQAYLAGANADGDERLAALSARAHASIDAAVASGAITPAQALEQRERVATGLVTSRLQGVFDALPDPAAKKAFAESLDEQYADPTSPLAKLEPGSFMRIRDGLMGKAERLTREAEASTALERQSLKRALDDDLTSMEMTGQGLVLNGAPLDPKDVTRVLGADDAADWLEKRGMAQRLHAATSTFPMETADAIEARLAGLEPKPGEEGFARKQAVFEAASKRAKAVLELRRDDPARAAEEAFPAIGKEEDPLKRAQARLDAQAALGIGAKARQPLTAMEARALADRIEMVEDNPDALDPEMKAIMAEAQKTYGTLADDVMVQVLEQRGIGKVTGALGVQMMREMNLGRLPPRQTVSNFAAGRRMEQGDRAMAGKTAWPFFGGPLPVVAQFIAGQARSGTAGRAKAPNAAQVRLLQQNPALAAQFEQKFGAGSAAGFLKERAPPSRRKLADGSVVLTYEDGWVETLKPDGTIDGRQGP